MKTTVGKYAAEQGITEDEALMLAPTRKSFLEKLKEDYASARHLIEKEILSNEEPAAEIDLTSPVQLSARLLGDYVNLDWQHRVDIGLQKASDARVDRHPLSRIPTGFHHSAQGWPATRDYPGSFAKRREVWAARQHRPTGDLMFGRAELLLCPFFPSPAFRG